MKLNFKIFFIIFFLSSFCLASNHGLDGYQMNTIDAVKNARYHANMGNLYFDDKNYNAAIKEYEIAYKLTADTNSYAPYLYNIANCMIHLGKYSQAKPLLDEAIKKDCINMTYYQALVDCYVALGTYKKELSKRLNDYSNPYNRIVAGLIYMKTGQRLNAKIIFDEFAADNPDMIITYDVKELLKKL